MNSSVKIATAAALSAFALAGVARAEEVHISLDGKSAKTVHAEIIEAAYTVCRTPDLQGLDTASPSECVAATIDKAEADYRRLTARGATQMARADLGAVASR